MNSELPLGNPTDNFRRHVSRATAAIEKLATSVNQLDILLGSNADIVVGYNADLETLATEVSYVAESVALEIESENAANAAADSAATGS